jgi:hemoglobin
MQNLAGDRGLWITVIIAIVFASGCGSAKPFKNTPQDQSGHPALYDRIGGTSAVTAIADQLVDRALADPNVNFRRAGYSNTFSPTPDRIAEVKMYLAQYIGMVCDGPQLYEGRNLLDVHHGMRISESEWYAFMDDLKAVLAASRIAQADQTDVLRRVAASHDVIVNK